MIVILDIPRINADMEEQIKVLLEKA
jgi:hypothetical protein